jgi:hypothetical protein
LPCSRVPGNHHASPIHFITLPPWSPPNQFLRTTEQTFSKPSFVPLSMRPPLNAMLVFELSKMPSVSAMQSMNSFAQSVQASKGADQTSRSSSWDRVRVARVPPSNVRVQSDFHAPSLQWTTRIHLTLTHIPEFQLLHTPAAFQAERVAWRIVIYLNLIRSVRR